MKPTGKASKYAELVATTLKYGIQWPTRGYDDVTTSNQDLFKALFKSKLFKPKL